MHIRNNSFLHFKWLFLALCVQGMFSSCSSTFITVQASELANIEQSHRIWLATTSYLKTKDGYHYFLDVCWWRHPNEDERFRVKEDSLILSPKIIELRKLHGSKNGIPVIFDYDTKTGKWNVFSSAQKPTKLRIEIKQKMQRITTTVREGEYKMKEDG